MISRKLIGQERPAAYVCRSRRCAAPVTSAQALSRAAFFRMLARLIPTQERRAMPWDAIPWRPRIQIGLFVHRVDGLEPVIYAFVRDPDKVDILKRVKCYHWTIASQQY